MAESRKRQSLKEQLKERIPHQHCETCGLFHDSEGEWCPVGLEKEGYVQEPNAHCRCWWDGEECCRCGSNPCAAATLTLG